MTAATRVSKPIKTAKTTKRNRAASKRDKRKLELIVVVSAEENAVIEAAKYAKTMALDEPATTPEGKKYLLELQGNALKSRVKRMLGIYKREMWDFVPEARQNMLDAFDVYEARFVDVLTHRGDTDSVVDHDEQHFDAKSAVNGMAKLSGPMNRAALEGLESAYRQTWMMFA